MTKNVLKGVNRGILTFFAIASVFIISAIETKAAGTGVVSINSCSIGGANVVVSASAADIPDSDDGIYYLYAERTYQDTPVGDPVAAAPIGASASFTVPLGYNTAQCHLYDKFQIAVLQGGKVVPVCAARYISNPEALAEVSLPKKNTGKKGLILDGAKIGNGNTEVLDLGVQQAAYNIILEDVIGGDKAIAFDYNGKTFYFDSALLSQYDHCVRTTSSQGIGMTMVLLNRYVKGEEYMISPYSRGGIGRAPYYMMNTSEEKGLETLEAVVSFLAHRYNGKNGLGQIDNWVIGNEVNARNQWNYASNMDIATYARLYADSLRVCYNAIRSRNANATVCMSLDNEWNSIANGAQYTARTTLDYVNAYIVALGNFDWGLAYHPYNYPLTWTSFWTAPSAKAAGMIQHNIDTPFISMENIEQLTDYMCQAYLRGTNGQVRPILLTEIGYSSTQGDEAQAAAIVYAYHRTAANQYLNLIIFSRQSDDASEVKAGLSEGLTGLDGRRKLAYEFYKHMNGARSGDYVSWSSAYIGIADWASAMNVR